MFEQVRHFLVVESFRPGLIGLLTNPFYIARKGLYNNIADLSTSVSGRVLDVGCGIKPYKDLFRVNEYIGLELESSSDRGRRSADVFYDGRTFPFESNMFDAVVTNQVLEHVFEPDDFLKEIYRVLRANGRLLLSVPFLWDEHEKPVDYGRYTSFGLRYLLEKHGFTILEHRKTGEGMPAHCQLLSCYLFKQVSTWNSVARLVAWILFSTPLNLIGETLGRILPPNNDLYLDNIVLASKVG
jgi:SAM-dependent methyltransferase